MRSGLSVKSRLDTRVRAGSSDPPEGDNDLWAPGTPGEQRCRGAELLLDYNGTWCNEVLVLEKRITIFHAEMLCGVKVHQRAEGRRR